MLSSDPPRDSADVIVVGGGVIGLAVAWVAARRGLRVTVLERGAPEAATSWVAAGMIAPVSEASPSESRLLALARASAARYPSFVAELAAASGLDPGYRSCGTLLLARDADEAAALDREFAVRQRLGLPVRRLRASDARAIEPALSPRLRSAIEIPDDHAIDPRQLIAALRAALLSAGGTLLAGDAQEIVGGGGDTPRARGVRLTSGERIDAEQVVIAAGPWSGAPFGLPLEARVEIRPVKGQLLILRDPAGPGAVERVLRMAPGYLVPRGDGRYVLGASSEERGFDRTVTAGAVHEMLRDAIELVPGIAEWTLEETLVGTRPGTRDNLPVIGASTVVPGLHWATGHYRHGVLLAPITAELVAAQLVGDPVPAHGEPVMVPV